MSNNHDSKLTLCLDLGNSQLFGGVFDDDELLLRFRHDSKHPVSSDQMGIFLREVLRENGVNHPQIAQIAYCSVVPHLDYSLQAACIKYFGIDPFVLQTGVKTGLKIKYKNPSDVGADRIANAVAAIRIFPNRNIIIVDFGTATTFCAINSAKEYLGGLIMPGMRLAMESLQSNTSKLSSVNIIRPETVVGRTTVACIQSGLYFGHRAALADITQLITRENFREDPMIIGTGGFAHLFSEDGIFDTIQPNLVLTGLRMALEMNTTAAA